MSAEAYFHLLPEAKRLSMCFQHSVVVTRTTTDYKAVVRAIAIAWMDHCSRVNLEKGYSHQVLWRLAERLTIEGHLNFLFGKLPHANDNDP